MMIRQGLAYYDGKVINGCFASAMDVVRRGGCVTRASWGDPQTYILLSGERLSIRKSDGTTSDLILVEADLSGSDWIVVHDEKNDEQPALDR